MVLRWWPRESMLWGSSTPSEFRTSLSKVLTLWHCVKVKQRYHSDVFFMYLDLAGVILQGVENSMLFTEFL